MTQNLNINFPKEWMQLLVVTLIFGLMVFIKHPAISLLFLVVVFISGIVNVKVANYAVIASLPLQGADLFPAPVVFPLLPILAVLTGFLFRYWLLEKLNNNVSFKKILLLVLILVWGSSILLISGYVHRTPHLLLFVVTITYLMFLISYLEDGTVGFFPLVVVMGLATILSVIPEIISGSLVGSTNRLAIGGNIRALANPAGFVFTSTALYWIFEIYEKKLNKSKYNPNRARLKSWVYALICLVMLILLLGSISRGVILSTIGAVLITIFIYFLKHVMINLRISKKSIFIISVMTALIYPILYLLLPIVNRIMLRFERLDAGVGIRQELWMEVINQMTIIQLIFGGGIATFRDFSNAAGSDWYAHSIFVDSLVSFGIMGFIILVSVILFFTMKSLQSKDWISIGLIIYICLSYSTHGAINAIIFLVSFSLIIGRIFYLENGNNSGNKFILA